jgi:hypothetical protein
MNSLHTKLQLTPFAISSFGTWAICKDADADHDLRTPVAGTTLLGEWRSMQSSRLMIIVSTPSVLPRLVVMMSFESRAHDQRVYYLSLEFLMGRTLDNAVLNLGVRPTYETALQKLGFVSDSGRLNTAKPLEL